MSMNVAGARCSCWPVPLMYRVGGFTSSPGLRYGPNTTVVKRCCSHLDLRSRWLSWGPGSGGFSCGWPVMLFSCCWAGGKSRPGSVSGLRHLIVQGRPASVSSSFSILQSQGLGCFCNKCMGNPTRRPISVRGMRWGASKVPICMHRLSAIA